MRTLPLSMIGMVLLLAGSAAAQNDAELANPEYWRARFSQIRGEIGRAITLERDAREELKELQAEAPKGERERDEAGWQREEEMSRDEIRRAAAMRVRAESELEALTKAAKGLDIPPHWYGGKEEAPAAGPAPKKPASAKKKPKR